MVTKNMMYVDLTKFYESIRLLDHRYVPEALTEAFSDLAILGRNKNRAETAIKFELHSQYIPNSIKAIPSNASQKEAARNSLRRKHDIMAAVYVRGANTPKKDMGFMVDHEGGETRLPQGAKIATPMPDLEQYGSKNAGGSRRKKWRPAQLLRTYNESGKSATHKGKNMGPQSRRVPGKPFLLQSKGESYIVRRLKKNAGGGNKGGGTREGLEFLYSMQGSASIKKEWGFEHLVHHTVQANYGRIIAKYFKRIPNQGHK